MAQLAREFERRDQPRVRRRLACSLLMDGRLHAGLVREISARSLLVESDACLPGRGGAIVVIPTPEGERFLLEITGARARPVARSLSAATRDAAVLQVEQPPASWVRYCRRALAREEATP